ncbi:helix-turn-helix domain-containing protein [Microbacterium sp. ZW T2_14]|uniref:helix-turn-helix domain-containing protein n=1 Tax=Microbacterium sp. ZW T2_14 TaxID=3378079 RepID=UPI003852C9A2
MTNSKDVQEFLKSRRARLTPEMAGVPTYGGIRRVPGLRREELAMISGMSVDYYNRLERGNLSGVSDSILESLARALKLDDAERTYLFDLARAANASPPRQRRRVTQKVRPSIQHLLDGMTGIPAFVQNGRLDVLAMNDLARALYHSDDDRDEPVNFARFVFLDESSVTQLTAWDAMAEDTVAILRQEAARDPHNRDLSDLIGELSTKSEKFRKMWAQHNVRFHRTGTKSFRHPAVGQFELTFQAMQLPGDEGLTLFAYTAEPGSRGADALKLLATWSATERANHADIRSSGRSAN